MCARQSVLSLSALISHCPLMSAMDPRAAQCVSCIPAIGALHICSGAWPVFPDTRRQEDAQCSITAQRTAACMLKGFFELWPLEVPHLSQGCNLALF